MQRIIKRYQNRKLYDTKESSYVSLKTIEEMIRQGEDLKIIDNKSGEDITHQILVQIILRMDNEAAIPMEGLKSWINQGSDTFLRVVQKTVERSRAVADKVDADLKIKETLARKWEEKKGFEWNLIREQIERFTDWVIVLFTERLRRGLLRIPTEGDWKRISGKLDDLDDKIKRLSAYWEEQK